MKSIPCRYCYSPMEFAFPGPGQQLLCCDRCLATCILKDDGSIIDWRKGRRTKEVMEVMQNVDGKRGGGHASK